MRTISATLDTREETEVAERRLAAIGVAPELITVREVAETGGFFVSAKVMPEQVRDATLILKRSGEGPGAPGAAEAELQPQVETDRSTAPAHIPAAAPAAPVPMPIQAPAPGPDVSAPVPAQAERPQFSKLFVIFCLIILAGFITGAVIGRVL